MHNNGTFMETWPRASIAADLIPTAGMNLFCTETVTPGFNQQSAYDIKKNYDYWSTFSQRKQTQKYIFQFRF